MYEKILVATDGSTLSKKAITSAIALAEFHGASLIAVKVVPRFTQTYFEGSIQSIWAKSTKLKSLGQTMHTSN